MPLDTALLQLLINFSLSYYKYLNLVSFDGGTGKEDDPYLISNAKQFDAIRNDLDAYYKLTKDINLNYDINDQNICQKKRMIRLFIRQPS